MATTASTIATTRATATMSMVFREFASSIIEALRSWPLLGRPASL